MKKLLLITLLSLSMISLVACGSDAEESESVAEIVVPEKTTEEETLEVDEDLPEVITEETEETTEADDDNNLVLIDTELHIFNETGLTLNGMVFQPTGPVDATKSQTFTGPIADEAHGTMDYLLSSEALVLDIIATDGDGNEITFAEVDFSKIKATGTGKDGIDAAEASLYLEAEEGEDDEIVYTARVELGVEE